MPRIHITPVVLNLLIINALIFLTLNLAPQWEDYFILHKSNALGMYQDAIVSGQPGYVSRFAEDPPYGSLADKFLPSQIVTAFFSHTALWHFFMNMYALFSFGPMVEMVLGARRFLIAYLFVGVLSTAMVAFLDPSPIPVLGASGALFGLTVIYASHFPNTQLGLMFLPFRFRIKSFLIGVTVISAALVVAEVFTGQSMGGISHFGHLTGIIAGFLYLQLGRLRRLGK